MTKQLIKVFIVISLVLVAIIIAIYSGHAVVLADNGEELNENIHSLLDGIDLSDLENYLATHESSFLFKFGDTAHDIIEYLIIGNLNIDYSSYLNELFSVLFENVLSLVPAFAQVIAVSILCAVVSSAEGGVVSKTTAKVIRVVCYSLIIAIISSMFIGVVSAALESVRNIKRQVELVTPILVTLTVLTGGSGSSAIYQPSALFLSSGAIEIINSFVFPATIAVVVLNFISKISPDISFSGTTKLVKSLLKWVMGITVTVFSIFITVQSSAASLFDGIFFKATKYLVGSSVPIVGNFLSAGVDMIVSAGSIIKSSVGIFGIVLLLTEVAQPIVLLVAFSLILKVVGAIVQPLGECALYSLFSDLSNDMEYFIAGLLTVSFMYALIIMLMINSASNFI